MNRWSVDRWAASTGLGFAVLLLVGNLLPGSPKKWNATGDSIQSYLRSNHHQILIGTALLGVAYIFFLWFLSSFAGMYREAGQGRLSTIMYGAGVATVALAAIGDGLMLGMTKTTYDASPATMHTIYGISTFVYNRLFWTMAAFALATWLATWRSKALPDWYAWVTLAAAAIFVLGGLAVLNNGFFTISGGMGFIAFLAIIIWVALSSVLLVQKTA
jgi:hypothetical protein